MSDAERSAGFPWAAAWGAFVRGVTRPTLPALVGLLVFAFAELAVLGWLVTPARLTSMTPGLLMRHPDDDGASVTLATLRMVESASAAPSRPLVVVVGASSLREALPGGAEMEAELARLLGPARGTRGQPPRSNNASGLSAYGRSSVGRQPGGVVRSSFEVHDLTTSGQELYESLALLETVPESTPAVLVLGVGPLRFAAPAERTRDRVAHADLAIPAAALDAAVAALGLEPPPRSGLYFLDHLQFFVSRPQVPWRWLRGPVELRRHRYLTKPPWNDAKWEKGLTTLRGRVADAPGLMDAYFDALAARLPRLTAGGRHVVAFLEPPVHPRARETLAPAVALYRPRIEAFVQAHDVPFWNVDAAAALAPEDFHDYTHLGTLEAMNRYQHALAERIAPLLGRCLEAPEAGCQTK